MLGTFDLKEIEERIFEWWEREKIYREIKKAEPEDKVWRFIDGPPYTTGDVHIGTAWNKILKDCLIHYKRMQGFRVTDTPGYDTHGLPIEVVIEKELGFKNKKDIIQYGLDKFISKCRKYAESKIPEMNKQFKRLGCTFWNWENPYVTLENTYIQGVWWTIKKAWENNLLYKFYKPQNCCPRCATALAKHEYEYYNIHDNAIYVKFRSFEDPKKFYLIWTTTPWTLVANMNIMASPINEYVEMRVKDEIWIMGIAATANLLQGKLGLTRGDPEGFEYGRRFKGKELEGKRYIHPLAEEVPMQDELEKQQPKVHTIVMSEKYVKEGEGVGLVHSAPGHGPEDFEVGIENKIPIFNPVDMSGCYTAEGGIFKDQYVFDANSGILDLLKEKGTLIYMEDLEHEYAHCWRCKSKLIYRATEQWFFKTSELRDKMLEENNKINWIPEEARKRFGIWLKNLQDWCCSRQRFWGIPLSIWECEQKDCDNIEVIGSVKELEEKSGTCPNDLHKQFMDKITWKCFKCGGVMRRVPDLADVWLDSGSVMWAAQKFVDGEEHYETWVPSDFILEGKDQIRGWFNSLLSSAMVSSEKGGRRKNFNACYMHGWTLSHGIKMSKSLGNALNPEDIIEGKIEILTEKQKEKLRNIARELETSKFDKSKKTIVHNKLISRKIKYIKDDKRFSNIKGIETFRFFSVMAAQPARDFNFDYKEYVDTFRVLNTFWNCYIFTEEKMNLNNFDRSKHKFKFDELNPTNKWILSKINTLIYELSEIFDKYLLPQIPVKLQEFILNDLSRWYITIIRDSVELYSEDLQKHQTLDVLFYVLKRLLLVMAPITPMLTEEIYQEFIKEKMGNKSKKSIHLELWPKINKKYINPKLELQMEFARQIIESVRAIKTENKIKLRWPTKALFILPKENMPELIFHDLIQQKSNVKEVTVIKKDPKLDNVREAEISGCKIFLDLEDTEALQQERIIRDLLRTIQTLRKRNKFKTGEEIFLRLATTIKFVKKALNNHRDSIISKVTAGNFEILDEELEEMADTVNHNFYLCLNGSCFASVREKQAKKVQNGEPHFCSYCGKKITPDSLGKIQIYFKGI
ncbi:MAG: isoleucine--tRNA ligase [Promethearchaeota archaeon]